MLTNKVFLRKTQKGNILKIVREHYLRDDIWCGSTICLCCMQKIDEKKLSAKPGAKSKVHKYPHYLIIDTNVVLNQIDVLEEDALCNIIILTTVLDEVKHKSSAVYKRLKDLISNPAKNYFVFVNEHHNETYVERDRKESPNDRNDRAIRVATKWYEMHLNESQKLVPEKERIRTILLTDDIGNKDKALEDKLIVSSVADYVKSLKHFAILEDKLSQKNFVFEQFQNAIFPTHLTPVQIHEGIKAKEIFQGSFVISRDNYLEGFVNVEGFEKSVLVQGRDGLNRAVDGDIVAVKILPKNKWTVPSEIILQDDNIDPEEVPEEETKLIASSSTFDGDASPTGIIVGIIRRKWRQYCGILQANPVKGSTRHMFIPAEKKIPRVRIESRQAEHLYMQRIIVAIDQWPRHSRYPLGHFVRTIGPLGDKDTENEVLLIEHDVRHSKFSEEVLSFLPKMPWNITDEDYSKRVDLRDIFICSVDPPGCTDIDDALHCRQLSDGNYEIGVHIADVSHFIRPGNALDIEAASRATTVYLVDKRIDMVPELLSSNLCSLRGGVERFAFSCIWKIDENANILDTKFHKSVIKSKCALTYEEAQLIIDDSSQQDEIAFSLRNLNKLAKILKKKRIQKGAIVLASLEIRFQVDSETHDPIEVEAKKLRETNSMVEEFMLLANVSVAEKIEREFPECAMLRRHPEPPQSNFDPLIKAGRNQGFEIITTTGRELATSLDNAVKKDNNYFNVMLRILATRCMMQAVYFISGTVQKDQFFHYGLAAPIYTHFTSPIRRYADIIVHRLLAACIGSDTTNRMAQYAGRASVALNTHIFFRGKSQDEDGYVLFVRKNALQILIPKFGLEGTIYMSSKDDKSLSNMFTYCEEDQTQRCGDIIFHSFDPVTVRLNIDSSNVQREKLVFKLVKPYIEGFSVSSDNSENTDETVSKRKSVDDNQEKKKKQKKSKKQQ